MSKSNLKLNTSIEINGVEKTGSPTSTLINDIINSILNQEAITQIDKIRLIDNNNVTRQEINISATDLSIIDSTLKIEKTFIATGTFGLGRIEVLSGAKTYFTYTIATQIIQNNQYKITITVTINSQHTITEQPQGANTRVNDIQLRKNILYRLRGDNAKLRVSRARWYYSYPSILLLDKELTTDATNRRAYHTATYFTRGGYLRGVMIVDADLNPLIEIDFQTYISVSDMDQAQYTHTFNVS